MTGKHTQSGFTIIELLVSSTIGLMIVALSMGSVVANRDTYQFDLARTTLNQNLRSAIDLIGMNTRIAGENLSSSFPAIELVNGTAGASDTFTMRRNLVDEVLNLCQTITAGSSTTSLYFAVTAATPGCVYGNNTFNYNSWRNWRLSHDNSVKGYLYNISTKEGEFFDYISEVDSGVEYFVRSAAHTWSYNYTTGSSAIYLLEEWKVKLLDNPLTPDILQVEQNMDTTNPLNIIWGVTDFQASINKNDGTTVTSFDRTQNWATIASIEVSISGSDSFKLRTITNTLTSRFFPRNVLSR